YNPDDGPACTPATFRPDLASEAHTAWNNSIVQVFTQHYSEIDPTADRAMVQRIFERHLQHLRIQYKNTSDGMEAIHRRQRAANRIARQDIALVRRIATAAIYPELSPHVPMLQALGRDGMSSDESDYDSNGNRFYRGRRKQWRHPALSPWLQLFDKVFILSPLCSNGMWKDIVRRYHSDEVSPRVHAVRALPRNAY
ncbi:hypothetical protein C8Q80DRAFT_1052803, partial [Daedaleopsis nitida]